MKIARFRFLAYTVLAAGQTLALASGARPSAPPATVVDGARGTARPRGDERWWERPYTFRKPDVDVRKPRETRWYGDLILVIDFLSITSLSVATVMPIESAQQKFLLGAGIGGYALGGPTVHAGHGHVGNAVGSLALRALPPLVMLEGATTDVCNAEGDECTFDRSLFFVGVALVPVVMLIDALVIAREEIPTRPNSGMQIMPWLEPTTSRFAAGIRGAF